MTVGPLEGLTSAVGDELTELAGFRSTRLTAQALAAQTVQTGVNTASSVAGTVITFPVSTLIPAVMAGQRFILRSGSGNGQSLDILTVDNPQQITLNGTLPIGAFTTESWEIQIDAETTFNVETTLDWPATGTVFVDGVRYIYGSKTLTTLDDLEHFDGVDFVPGVKQQHDPPAEVLDFTRDFSALDITRRSFLVDFATGDDLSRLGANINVPRPPQLTDDDIYRKLIKAIAYAPRGTIFAIEQALDALLGETVIDSDTLNATGTGDPTVIVIASGTFDPAVVPGMRFRITNAPENPDIEGRTVLIDTVDSTTQVTLQLGLGEDFNNVSWEITEPNWEIFEDLTLGSINNTCTVFFRSINQAIDEFAGKTFLDGEELVPLTSTTTATLAQTPIRVAGARLAPEPGQFGVRRIDSGTDSASSTGGPPAGALPITVTGPAATFDTRIRPGDLFVITSGSKAGQRATIQSRDSDTQLTMGPLRGQSQRQFDDTIIASGSFLNYVSIGTTLTLSAGTFPAEVLVGMTIRVTGRTVATGTGLGFRAEIASIAANRESLEVVGSFGFTNLVDVDWEVVILEGNGFTDVSFEIIREVSDFRRYRPSEEEYIEYPGDAGTSIWTYAGVGAEGTFATLTDDATDGEFLRLTRNVADQTFYRRDPLRILPESRATFECTMRMPFGGNPSETDGEQMFMRMSDGEREITVGAIEDAGGTYGLIGFYKPSITRWLNIAGALTQVSAPVGNTQTLTQTGGSFYAAMVGRRIKVYSGGSGTNHGVFLVTGFVDTNNIEVFNPNGALEIAGMLFTFGFADVEGNGTLIAQGRHDFSPFDTFKIAKDGRNTVKLYKNGHVIDIAEYEAFDTTTDRRLEFGAGGTNNTPVDVRQVDWSCDNNDFDLWNAHIPRGEVTNGGNNTPGTLVDLDANGFFLAGDVTAQKRIRIRSVDINAGGIGALGRNVRGEWELSSFTNADEVDFIAPTYSGARFDSSFGDRITIEDFPEAFIIPDMLGPNQQIEILTGPNAGTYDIDRFIELRTVDAVQATSTWSATDHFNLADGETFTVIDALQNEVTFEFKVTAGHTVTAGNREVDVVGLLATQVASAVVTAINLAYNENALGIFASSSFALITLTQSIPGIAGNTAVADTVANLFFSFNDFTGGEEETTEIRDLLENDDGTAFTTLEAYTPLTSTDGVDFIQKTNIVEVSNPPAGGFATSVGDRWRLVPTFEPADECTVELVDAGSIAGANITFRQDLADHDIVSGEVIAVERSLVLSAQVISPNDSNDMFGSPPPDFDFYPFYLFDGFGFARTVVDFLTAAGVIPDFDRFFRDATGPHIIP